MTIRPLSDLTQRRLVSGQVLLDIPSLVKELLENSLDAGATTIAVKLSNHGLTTVTVADNGCGIDSTSHHLVGIRNTTSKLAQWTDLERVTSLGFRGEALSSICSTAYAVQITTRTAVCPVGSVLTLDNQGRVTRVHSTSAEVGTTVFIEKPLSRLPVRREVSIAYF
ncbi:histidine kinase-like ATPase [Dimargaris cristalligena]|uniref:Histidine kinase-like ATPase n=1 Tax=Dimargaris cristalligena TaxID=215637 RepID=A0A4P9ZQ74_9FUNG|nr:histidine kinase-like ATPase [Dimargaris cristalligena]|eukprot:RKP34871.1 histidine kinase-like ATPase [Dimargaris cristalligena]